MKLSKRLLGILLLAGVLAATIYSLAVASPDKQLPFKGSSFEYVIEKGNLDGSDCPADTVIISGSGTATYLGAFTIVRRHCFTMTANGPLMHDGAYEITAANGDRLWGTYEGTMELTEFDGGVPVRGTITSPSTIDGGTGRFAGAHGEYLAVGDYNLQTDEGDFVFDGRVHP